MLCPPSLSKHVFFPLWDVWDSSEKLKELKRMQSSQWQSREEIEQQQWEKFKRILNYAATQSPYYKALLNEAGVSPESIHSREDLVKIPITKKNHVRENINNFISDEYQIEKLESAKTGGSTGFSLKLYFDKQCQERRNAAAMRSDQWAGWDLGSVRGDLWGNPPVAKTMKQKLRNDLLDRAIYLDTMQLNSETMSEFNNRCQNQNVSVIFGHAHSIYIYAKFIRESGIKPSPLEGIIATSMMLLEKERRIIEEAFNCPVTNRYGCEEVGLIACQCEQHQGMHINAEHVLVEFLREDGSQADDGEIAKIVITDLNNFGMPLLRYQIEDMGKKSNTLCACGRGLPLINELSGRVADFLQTAQGDSISGISLIERTLTKIPGIEQMQIVQNSLEKIVINRVKAKEHSIESDQALIEELHKVFSEVSIAINDVKKNSAA